MKKMLVMAAGLLLAGTAHAADNVAPTAKPAPEDDLKCGAWAAYIVGSEENEQTQTAYGFAMAYFLGLYEGGSGEGFEQEMLRIATEMDADPSILDELDLKCQPRMDEFGKRLVAWGDASDSSGSTSAH